MKTEKELKERVVRLIGLCEKENDPLLKALLEKDIEMLRWVLK